MSLGTEYGVNGEVLGKPKPDASTGRCPIFPSMVEGLPSPN